MGQTVVIPKRDDIPPWLYTVLRQLADGMQGANTGLAAVGRGESPIGGGTPLVDVTKFFYKPGIAGGQVAHGATEGAGSLTFSSTAHSVKGFIYLSEDKASAFDEAHARLGISSAAPAAKLEIKQPGTTQGTQPNAQDTPNTSTQWIGDDGSTGTTRYLRVNELVANDATYVDDQGALGLGFSVVLPNITPQPTSATITCVGRWRWNGANSAGIGAQITYQLTDGNGVTIHTTSPLQLAPPGSSSDTGYVQFSFTLTPTEIGNITNWNAMKLTFTTGGGGFGYSGTIFCSWLQLQLVGVSAVDLVDLYDTNANLVSGFNSAGALFFKTGAALGRLLTSDANGVSSWTTPNLLSVSHGDTVAHTPVLGDMIYANGTPAWTALAGNTTATKQFLTQTGTGSVSAAPSWGTIANADVPGVLFGKKLQFDAAGDANSCLIVDAAVNAKQLTFNLSGSASVLSIIAWSPSVARTLTIPDLTGTLAMSGGALTLTGVQWTLKNGTNNTAITLQPISTDTNTTHLLSILNLAGQEKAFIVGTGDLTVHNVTINGSMIVQLLQMKDFVNISQLSRIQAIDTGTGVPTHQFSVFDAGAGITYDIVERGPGSAIWSAQTLSLGTQTLTAVPASAAGWYRVSVYLVCSTAGTGGTVQVNVTWTRNGVTRTISGPSSTVTVGLTSTANAAVFNLPLPCDASTNIQYTTTVSGATGSPKYDLIIDTEWMGAI